MKYLNESLLMPYSIKSHDFGRIESLLIEFAVDIKRCNQKLGYISSDRSEYGFIENNFVVTYELLRINECL